MALSRSSFSFKQWLSFEIHTHIRALILQLWVNVCILSNDIGSDVLQGDSWTEIFATRNHHERWTYVLLLKSKLEFQMRVHNCDIFMHNGASDHQSKVVKNFLNQNHIQNLSWPGNSLDLNPIENLWNLTKKKLSEKNSSNLDALQTATKDVWVRNVSPNYCCKLINSIPRRLQEIIKNKSGHTTN